MSKTLYIVVPCYNEQEVLPETAKRLLEKLQSLVLKNKIADNSRIMFVNDGSKDQTWSMIKGLCEENSVFAGVNLSRNRGHQNALLAGMATAVKYADMIVTMDADLQDDINAVDRMIDAYYEGNDVVYGVRSSRKKDTCFKRGTAHLFYKLMSFLGADIVYDHADYRLLSKRATENLLDFDEVNLFLRGIVPMIGFQSTTVEYEGRLCLCEGFLGRESGGSTDTSFGICKWKVCFDGRAYRILFCDSSFSVDLYSVWKIEK